MSKNNFGITPVLKDGKLQWIDLQSPTMPGFSIRLDKDLIVELHHYLGMLLTAEKSGSIEALTRKG